MLQNTCAVLTLEMVEYHAANDTLNKAILQKLADETDDAEISGVIGCYSIGAKGADIRKDLSKLKVQPLKKCAVYLGLYSQGDTKKLKAEIITDIMTRLNSLLMDLCGICGEYFNNELNDKPPFSCLICHQGCHTPCFDRIDTMFRALDANQRKALQFICTSCHSDHNKTDEEDTEITLNAPKVKKSPSKAEPTAKGPEMLAVVEDQLSPGSIVGDQHTDGEFCDDPEPPTNVIVCPQYKWGRCPVFETCEFRHPPALLDLDGKREMFLQIQV